MRLLRAKNGKKRKSLRKKLEIKKIKCLQLSYRYSNRLYVCVWVKELELQVMAFKRKKEKLLAL